MSGTLRVFSGVAALDVPSFHGREVVGERLHRLDGLFVDGNYTVDVEEADGLPCPTLASLEALPQRAAQ